MKISEYIFESIILEDKIDFLVNQQGDKIMSAYEKDTNAPKGLDARGVIYQLLKADPSKKSLQWLVNRYKEQNFRMEDLGRAKNAIVLFNKKKSGLDKKDINQYKRLSDLEDAVEDEQTDAPISSKEEIKRIKKEGVDVIVSGPDCKIIHVKTEEAACLYGRGTKWCTAYTDGDKENQFNNYNKDGPLYVALCKDGRKYQFHFEEFMFMDEKDNPVDIKKLQKKYPSIHKLFKIKEKEIATDIVRSVEYAETVLKGRFELGERAIATDAHSSYYYAYHVLEGKRFPLGEETIATDAECSYLYAIDIVKGRFELGEQTIKQDPEFREDYEEAFNVKL